MSWLAGEWSELHRVTDREEGLWSRWCEDGTGLYRLVALMPGAGIDATPLQRVCGLDPTGTLYIGSTSSLHRRISQLVRSRDTDRFKGRNYRPLPTRLAEAFPAKKLAVCWINLPECLDRFADERNLIAAYVDTFGEPPPLNAMP